MNTEKMENKSKEESFRYAKFVFYMGIVLFIIAIFSLILVVKEHNQATALKKQVEELYITSLAQQSFSEDNTRAMNIVAEAIERYHSDPSPQTLRVMAEIGFSSMNPPFYSTSLSHGSAVRYTMFTPNGKPRFLTAGDDGCIKEWSLDGDALLSMDKTNNGHNRRVSSAVYSPDGKWILSASWDRTVKLWDRQGNLMDTKILDGVASHAQFSPDSRQIVACSRKGKAYIYVVNQGKLIGDKILNHGESVVYAEFSPDGKYILTRSWGRYVNLWNIDNADSAVTLTHQMSVTSANFFPDDGRELVLTSSEDGSAIVWNREGEELFRLLHDGSQVSYALFSPDKETIFTASADGVCHLWDLAGNKKRTFDAKSGKIISASYSDNGLLLVTVSEENKVKVWQDSGDIKARLKTFRKKILAAGFSPDNRKLVTACEDGSVRVWKMDTPIMLNLNRHRAGLNSAVFSTDGKWIVTASNDNSAILWESSGRFVKRLEGHTAPVRKAIFSPDSLRIVTVSLDRTAKLWDLTGAELKTMSHSFPVNLAVYSPGGKYIVTATDDGFQIRVWDQDGNGGDTLKPIHRQLITSLTFSAKGKNILTTSKDGSAKVTDFLSGKRVASFKSHDALVSSAVFSPDEGQKFVLTASHDKKARVWSIEKPKEPLHILSHQGPVSSAVYSPKGDYILTTSWDHTAVIWTKNGTLYKPLKKHTKEVLCGVFSPDGRFIVTTSNDETAILWNLEGEPLAIFNVHRGAVETAQFFPREKDLRILTASQDGNAAVWMTPGRIFEWLNTVPRPIPTLSPGQKKELEIKD